MVAVTGIRTNQLVMVYFIVMQVSRPYNSKLPKNVFI